MEEHSQWSAGDVLKFHDSDGPPTVMYFQTREEVVEAVNEIQWNGDNISRYSSKYHRVNARSHPGSTSAVEVNPSGSSIKTSVKGDLFNLPEDTRQKGPREKNTRWEIYSDWLQKWFPMQRPKNTSNDSLKPELHGSTNPPVPSIYWKTPINEDIYGSLIYIDKKNYKHALVFSSITNFNPSGIWVVEDLYNDSKL